MATSGEQPIVAASNGGARVVEDVEELFERTGDNFRAFQALARMVKSTFETVRRNEEALQRVELALDQLLEAVVM